MTTRSLPLLLLTAATLVASPATADAKKKKAPKPSIKVQGISVNQVYSPRGTTVVYPDSTNACYRMGGPSGNPDSLTAFVYVRAIKVPADAPMTYDFKTPWDTPQLGDTGSHFEGQFSKGLFKAYKKPQAQIFGGPATKRDRFTYRMLPTGLPTSSYMSGEYSFTVSVTVKGKVLKSSGKITVAC